MRKKILGLIVICSLLLTLLANTIPIHAFAEGSYQRIAGNDRYETSAAISRIGWETADTVIIARGDDFPDGLAGGPLAYKLDAPLLITQKDSIPPAVAEEIDRLKPQKAYILGGPGAISDKVEQTLESKGLTVERVYGPDRAATAAEIARIIGAPSGRAIIVTGLNFPDALAISPVAAIGNLPILFVYGNVIPEATLKVLSDLSIKQVDVIGGPSVVPDSVVKALEGMGINVRRIYGSNRELTALEIAKTYSSIKNGVFLATGYVFADALSAAPLAAKRGQPLLLCGKETVDKSIPAYIKSSGLTIEKVTVIGGEGAVSNVALFRLFNSGVIQIYRFESEKQVWGNETVDVLHFTVDNVAGAAAYRVYLRYSPYDYNWQYWMSSSFFVGPDGHVYFDVYCVEKGAFWAEIQAVDERENILARSQSFTLEIDARDSSGRLIVYTDEQLIYAVSQGIDPVVSDTAPQIQEYYSKAKSIISKIITPGMTDLQKEKAIHDYIVNNTRYDIVNYERGTIPPESYSPYGVLIKGVAVCEGYARATALLLNMAGIKSIVVTGEAFDGIGVEGHAWNIVEIDGHYYHLDTTWDDPVTPTGENWLRYDYFNLSDSEIAKDHFWDRDKYPTCSQPGPRP